MRHWAEKDQLLWREIPQFIDMMPNRCYPYSMSATYRVELIDGEGNELTMTNVPEVDDDWKMIMGAGGWKVLLVEEEKIILV